MADIEEPLQYGRLIGEFWAVLEDSNDPGEAPDTEPLVGTVTFEPSYKVLRVGGIDVARRGVVYVDTVTAQVVNGVLVDDFGEPGVSLLAGSTEEGDVFPHNLSWRATFNLTRSTGISLSSQPEPTNIRLEPGAVKSISDFTPDTISGGSVRVVSVDADTLHRVNQQVEYIDEVASSLGVVIDEGVVKGEPGPPGVAGPQGELGPYGPPGKSDSVEIYNYVSNPVPTSNDGYEALNGTVAYANREITLTANSSGDLASVSWVKAVPAYPGTNMYLQFDADTESTVPIQTSIIFLNANLEPVDSSTIVHGSIDGIDIPDEVFSPDEGTYSHMAYTDKASSFAIFTIGFSEPVSSGTNISLHSFYFSDSAGFYFSGSETIEGYHIRWTGAENDSYSVLIPLDLVAAGAVFSVNGKKGDVTIDAEEFGLDLVDNTPDEAKPISNDVRTALDSKVNSSELQHTIAEVDRISTDVMYLKDFSRYGTQEVWRTSETFVDVSYVLAPIGGSTLVRLTIPGSITGNSPSSIPTVELSNDGYTWRTWRTLTDSPPGGISYTSIDGTYDRFTSTLKVLVRELSSSGAVTLHLFTVDNSGVISTRLLGEFSSAYDNPSITSSFEDDGILYLYYQDSGGVYRRTDIPEEGVLTSSTTNLSGLRSGFPAKISRFYGSYVAATQDNSTDGSPGILLSRDGVSWYNRGLTGTHTWDREANASNMTAYPGVSKGKVGIFVDYIDSDNYRTSRLFATSSPTVSGIIEGLSTEPQETSTDGSEIVFPGTLAEVPNVFVSSNDSKLNLGAVAVTSDGGSVERTNMGESPSSNATIAWTAIS